jgi:predicted nucleotidyltransferase
MADRGIPSELKAVNNRTTTALQQAYTERAVEVFKADERVAAAWMKGSLVTGSAGLYSDVDMGLAVYDAQLASFKADRDSLLRSIGPLAGMGEASVGARVTVVLFSDPIEFDLTVDPLSAEPLYGPEIGWILFDKTGRMASVQASARKNRKIDPQRARDIVTAFWLRAPRMRRWVAQADLHRAGKELQTIRNWLVELMLIANDPDHMHTVQKDSFIVLSPHQWGELGATYVLPDFTPQALARCMMRLAYAMSIWGRAACARQGSEYPMELERVSARAVSQFYETVFGMTPGQDNGSQTE